MTTFTNNQLVKHNGIEYKFMEVSKRGGKSEYAFLWCMGRPGAQMKQVLISEITAAQ